MLTERLVHENICLEITSNSTQKACIHVCVQPEMSSLRSSKTVDGITGSCTVVGSGTEYVGIVDVEGCVITGADW